MGGKGAPGLILVAFSGRPTPPPPITGTVQITLGPDLEARDQLRAALADRGLDYTTVTEIPFEIALYGEGSARDMFRLCAALTTVPDMDTSQVTNMSYMFQDCSSLTTVPTMDTSKVTAMDSMFRACSALTYVPDMQTRNVTNVSYMFSNCSSLTDGNVSLIGRHPQVDSMSMTAGSGLTREPFYDGTDDGPTQRTVSIRTNYASPNNLWTSGTQAGATDLIVYFSERYVQLSEDVTCNRPVTAATQTVAPGTVIAAGSNIYPNDWGVTFTFTTT